VLNSATRPPGPAGPRAAEQTDPVPFDWRALERTAIEYALTLVDEAELAGLEFGQPIAWVTAAYGGRTDGLSPVHRVGEPIGAQPFTTCQEQIPAPIHWFTLSPALIDSMPRCRFCVAALQRLAKETAA